MKAYESLKQRYEEMSNLTKAIRLLAWDRDADIMPPDSAAERGQIIAQLEIENLRKATAPEIGAWMDKAATENRDDIWDQRNFMLMQEEYALSRALPEKLVTECAKAESLLVSAYGEAKPTSDWNAVKDLGDNLLRLSRERAKIFGDVLGCAPYDALLSQYSRGNNVAFLDPLFSELKSELIPLVARVQEKQKNQRADFDFAVDAPDDIKRLFIQQTAEKTGFSMRRGRIDSAVHPFSSGTKYDTRITYGRTDTISLAFHAVLHECGHALYDQNTPAAWENQPVGQTSDLALHESQSLFIEKQVAYGSPFLGHIYDAMRAAFPAIQRGGDRENFIATFHKVQPDFIRFTADEITYPLHVMHRYDIEKMLFDGTLKFADIPAAWNEKFEKDFGLKVPEHKLGCMQDIHWFTGLYGYFPTYTQGALFAAQLFAAAKRDIVNASDLMARGELKPLVAWMTDKVHQYGQLYDAPDLIMRATGEKPSPRFFIDHLKARYLA